MNSNKSLSVDKSDHLDLINTVSKRLNFATAANKSHKVTIEKLREEIKIQNENNKNLAVKLDRAVQLNNTRQILIKKLKDDLNKMRILKSETDATNQTLIEEIFELRYNSKVKLSATQEELMMLSSKNQEEQIELEKKLEDLKSQLNLVKREFKMKETQIAKFVDTTKNTVCSELVKLSKTVEEGSTRLKFAEEKSKELCKGIIKLLTMFYNRKMARRLVSDKISSQKSSKQDKRRSKDVIIHLEEGGDQGIPRDLQMGNKKNDFFQETTDEALKSLDNNQINTSTGNNLKDVIKQFHVLIHKDNFANELGVFLFNKIVLPFTEL